MLPAWCRKRNSSILSFSFIGRKSRARKPLLCCVRIKSKQDSEGADRPSPFPFLQAAALLHERARRGCVSRREHPCANSAARLCEGTWPSRHARVGCGHPDRHLSVSDFLTRCQPASASALALWTWTLVVQRMPSSGAQGSKQAKRAREVESPLKPLVAVIELSSHVIVTIQANHNTSHY